MTATKTGTAAPNAEAPAPMQGNAGAAHRVVVLGGGFAGVSRELAKLNTTQVCSGGLANYNGFRPGKPTRIGHCFAADPLINLADREELGHVGAGGYCLLASSVPGSRIGALLQRVS